MLGVGWDVQGQPKKKEKEKEMKAGIKSRGETEGRISMWWLSGGILREIQKGRQRRKEYAYTSTEL